IVSRRRSKSRRIPIQPPWWGRGSNQAPHSIYPLGGLPKQAPSGGEGTDTLPDLGGNGLSEPSRGRLAELGRRARFRSVWARAHRGSNPRSPTPRNAEAESVAPSATCLGSSRQDDADLVLADLDQVRG